MFHVFTFIIGRDKKKPQKEYKKENRVIRKEKALQSESVDEEEYILIEEEEESESSISRKGNARR